MPRNTIQKILPISIAETEPQHQQIPIYVKQNKNWTYLRIIVNIVNKT
jgi:hypothetical protein